MNIKNPVKTTPVTPFHITNKLKVGGTLKKCVVFTFLESLIPEDNFEDET